MARTRSRGRVVRYRCYRGFTLYPSRFNTCVRRKWLEPHSVCVSKWHCRLTNPAIFANIPQGVSRESGSSCHVNQLQQLADSLSGMVAKSEGQMPLMLCF